MKAIKRISKRALCLLLVLCLSLPMLSGCTDGADMTILVITSALQYFLTGKVDIPTPAASIPVDPASLYDLALDERDVHYAQDGGMMGIVGILRGGATLELTDVDCASIHVASTDAVVEVGAGSSVGILQCDGLNAAIRNAQGTVKNATVSIGGNGTAFEKMPEQLTVRPGAYCTVNGVLYDNRGGTEDLVLTGDAAGTPPQNAAKPSLSGKTTIKLPLGYSGFAHKYAIQGSPVPTVSVSGTANATIATGTDGTLRIPPGLPLGTYGVTIRAANVAGAAQLSITVHVVDAPVLTGASGAQLNTVTLLFDRNVEGLAAKEDITIAHKSSGAQLEVTGVGYPLSSTTLAVTVNGMFKAGDTYTATFGGVSVDFVAQNPPNPATGNLSGHGEFPVTRP